MDHVCEVGQKVGLRRRRILVITSEEGVGNWLRYALSGLHIRLRTKVVPDLSAALPALKRWRPEVVIFIEKGHGTADDRLMLLRTVLMDNQLSCRNMMAMVYSLSDQQLFIYHNIHVPKATLEDVALAAHKGRECPLFGCSPDMTSCFPKDCGFLPLFMEKSCRPSVEGEQPFIGRGRAES